uniref:DNA mismatch repair protein MutS n=1 Tax=uncultured bacterium CSLF42 TaxID=1091574 RepID=G4WVZ4_9BACT|nr:DNA mismatch repair protein MutS [uncultured bacterium CSLF42]
MDADRKSLDAPANGRNAEITSNLTAVPSTRRASDTPLMLQYQELKARYPKDLLFFRLGDFYELFDGDAKIAAPILEVALTHRQQIPMCGVPAHAVDPYAAKLLKAGFRVAIADQMEDPALAKGLVKRQIVRVLTPGTLQEDTLLPAKRCNFLAALAIQDGTFGLAAIECSTGEFVTTETSGAGADSRTWDEIVRLAPSEIVMTPSPQSTPWIEKLRKQGFCVTEADASDFAVPLAAERLKKQFGIQSLRGFGLEGKNVAQSAASAAVRYYESTQCGRPCSLQPPRTYTLDEFLQLDAGTLDHLDIVESGAPRPGSGPGSSTSRSARTLLDIMDDTLTPMGGRLLRRWIVAPLRSLETIRARQERVDFFLDQRDGRRHLRAALQGWPDMERILTRLASGTVSPRDLAHLTHGLKRTPQVKNFVQKALDQWQALRNASADSSESPGSGLAQLPKSLPEAPELSELLERAIVEAPPASLKDGGVIRDGYSAELDEVRSWIRDGKSRLLGLERREREQTGIGSLKVGFNNIFGYYIEVTKTHMAKVPANYIRKQTMANGERYITPELKEFETQLLGAEERALRLENALVTSLREAILKEAETLRRLSAAIAELDVFLSFAEVAERRGYVKPTLEDSSSFMIREGRHPVLENVLASGSLVPNDVHLDGRERQIVILTGPNMSGKSTYLRQTALIAILAQMGSYVPAAEARLGVLDHLFTRIGASDRLLEGESTFMVEMVETARILNHATPRSLVILDEVGRGTSTYDGMSIAWACIEYLHQAGPKVLFATHYLELTQLAGQLSGVCNAHVAAREWGDQVIFLHKVEPGPADRAYGIHVAKLAGVPKGVLERAAKLLRQFEQRQRSQETDPQPSLFDEEAGQTRAQNDTLTSGWGDELSQIDLNQITPMQALLKIQEWKNRVLQAKKEEDSL